MKCGVSWAMLFLNICILFLMCMRVIECSNERSNVDTGPAVEQAPTSSFSTEVEERHRNPETVSKTMEWTKGMSSPEAPAASTLPVATSMGDIWSSNLG